MGRVADRLEEAGLGLDHPDAQDRRHDHGGQHARVPLDQVDREVGVVEAADDDVVREVLGDARHERSGVPGVVGRRPELEQVARAVIGRAHLHDQVAAREGARDLDHQVVRLGAAVREAQALEGGHALDQLFGELDLERVGADPRAAAGDLPRRRLDDPRVRVAVDERRGVVREIDVVVAVHVDQLLAVRLDEERRERLERDAEPGVAAGQDVDEAAVELRRARTPRDVLGLDVPAPGLDRLAQAAHVAPNPPSTGSATPLIAAASGDTR